MENTDVSSSAAAAELLKAHGFSDAAKILLDTPPPSLSASTLYALAAQPPSVPLAPRFIVSTFSSSDREPKRFLDTYKRLRSFVNTSLDVVRTELTPLVYLVFVHLYLALLLRKSDADKREAKAFFRAVHGEHKLDHQEEVFALEKLGSADAVSKSDTAMTFIEHRYDTHPLPSLCLTSGSLTITIMMLSVQCSAFGNADVSVSGGTSLAASRTRGHARVRRSAACIWTIELVCLCYVHACVHM